MDGQSSWVAVHLRDHTDEGPNVQSSYKSHSPFEDASDNQMIQPDLRHEGNRDCDFGNYGDKIGDAAGPESELR